MMHSRRNDTTETTTAPTEEIASLRAELRRLNAILRDRKRAQRAAFAVDADQAAVYAAQRA